MENKISFWAQDVTSPGHKHYLDWAWNERNKYEEICKYVINTVMGSSSEGQESEYVVEYFGMDGYAVPLSSSAAVAKMLRDFNEASGNIEGVRALKPGEDEASLPFGTLKSVLLVSKLTTKKFVKTKLTKLIKKKRRRRKKKAQPRVSFLTEKGQVYGDQHARQNVRRLLVKSFSRLSKDWTDKTADPKYLELFSVILPEKDGVAPGGAFLCDECDEMVHFSGPFAKWNEGYQGKALSNHGCFISKEKERLKKQIAH